MARPLSEIVQFNLRSLRKAVSDKLQLKLRLRRFTMLYSNISGEPLTTGEALRILHAQIAGVALIFPCDMTLLLRFIFLIWFCLALWQCRTIGK